MNELSNPALFNAIFLPLFIFGLISYSIGAFLLGKVFKKAGVPQWVAWVPIYNSWKLLEMGNQQGFWAIVGFIPFVGLVSLIFLYIAAYHIGIKFGKESWFVLLALFIPLAWMIWLGFDDSEWQEKRLKSHAPRKITKKS